MSATGAMTSLDALRLLRTVRGDKDIVVSAMGAARDWMALGTHPRDWVFVPSSMGQATSLGLGLALARPDLRVIVLGGDGGLIMNLGSLITITGQAPANLFILIFDNGVYEVTGAQPTPAATAGENAVDLPAIVQGCGIRSIYHWSHIDDVRAGIDAALRVPGPTVIVLDVLPVPEARGPRSPGPTAERARRFREALQVD